MSFLPWLSGSAICPNSSGSSSTTQNKEVPGVQMGPWHSRRQTPHADLWHRPQHVGVTAFPSAMRNPSVYCSAVQYVYSFISYFNIEWQCTTKCPDIQKWSWIFYFLYQDTLECIIASIPWSLIKQKRRLNLKLISTWHSSKKIICGLCI